MIKNKTREELVQMVYDLISENDKLKIVINKSFENQTIFDRFKHKISSIYIYIISLLTNFKIKQTKLQFMGNPTLDTLLKALELANIYESKELSDSIYRDSFESVVGVKICKNCSGDIMQRLHNDYQRFILGKLALIEDNDILIIPIKFESPKYNSDFYSKNLPYTYYEGLYKYLNDMRRELAQMLRKGYTENALTLAKDVKKFEEYIETRKLSRLKQSEDGKIEDYIEPNTDFKLFTLELAYEMKMDGKTSKEIASLLVDSNGNHLTYQHIAKALKKYEPK